MATPERLRELASATDPRAGLTGLFFLAPGRGVTELLLVRHAQIEETALAHDLHLTELGREQAEVLGDYLAREPLEAVYASPTTRAWETAAPIARRHDVNVTSVEALRDIDTLRPFDRPLRELLAREFGEDQADARLATMRVEMTFDAMAPFFESSGSFRSRVEGALETLIERHAGGRVAVVTHGPAIMTYAALLLGSPRDFALNPRLTSITRVLAREGFRTLDCLNAVPHFGTL